MSVPLTRTFQTIRQKAETTKKLPTNKLAPTNLTIQTTSKDDPAKLETDETSSTNRLTPKESNDSNNVKRRPSEKPQKQTQTNPTQTQQKNQKCPPHEKRWVGGRIPPAKRIPAFQQNNNANNTNELNPINKKGRKGKKQPKSTIHSQIKSLFPNRTNMDIANNTKDYLAKTIANNTPTLHRTVTQNLST